MHQLSDSEFIGSKIVMSDPNFDPYYKWLGISPADQPANHYRLLGVDPFEADGDVIESAAQRQISHVRTFALGKYSEASQALLNELSTARVTLLNPDRKQEYDKGLRAELQSNAHSIDQGAGETLQQRALVEVAIEPVPRRNTLSSRRASAAPHRKKLPLGVIGLVVVFLGLVLTFLLYRSFSGGNNRVAVTNEKVLSEAAAQQRPTADNGSPPGRKEIQTYEDALGNASATGIPVDLVRPDSASIVSNETQGVAGADAVAMTSGLVGDPPPLATAPFDSATAKNYQQAWAMHMSLPVELTNSIGMTLRFIPPGNSRLGEGGNAREVTIAESFMLGTNEVSQEQYERIMDSNPSRSKGGIKPVGNVTWEDAAEFCRKLSELPEEKKAGRVYELPTEAQWEHACRSGTRTLYSFGNDESKLGEYGWFRDNSNGRTHPGGAKQPNPWGLNDMHGNVWEWCKDWYQADFPANASGSSDPPLDSQHVIRGGAWDSRSDRCRSGSRAGVISSTTDLRYGFRVLCICSHLELKENLAQASIKEASKESQSVSKVGSGTDSGSSLEPSTPLAPQSAISPFDSATAKKHQEAWANYLGVPVEFTNSIGMKFSLIPPGEFLMGDSKGTTAGGAGPHNGVTVPVRKVAISDPFFLGVHEVTRSQYTSVMDASPGAPRDGQLPINGMSWTDAVAFCKRLSRRSQGLGIEEQYSLPSEAQWEYACRAGSQSRYFFGEDATQLRDYAVSKASGTRGPKRVGSKKPNAWGLYDMHGNLWEWCDDWYGVYQVDSPNGPATGKSRIQRGGCWNDAGVTTGYRNMNPPQLQHNLHGFRVVLAISDQFRETEDSNEFRADDSGTNESNADAQRARATDRNNDTATNSALTRSIVGKKLRVDYQSNNARAEVILNPDGTWVSKTNVRVMPVVAGLWQVKEGKIFAYANNRTDEEVGDIYNVYSLDEGKLWTEHFFGNAKGNEGPVTILQPTTDGINRINFAKGQYVVEDINIDKRKGHNRLMFEFRENGDFLLNNLKKGSWETDNELLLIRTYSKELNINPCLFFEDELIGTYLNSRKQAFYFVGSRKK